jgi:hypothetical protein
MSEQTKNENYKSQWEMSMLSSSKQNLIEFSQHKKIEKRRKKSLQHSVPSLFPSGLYETCSTASVCPGIVSTHRVTGLTLNTDRGW